MDPAIVIRILRRSIVSIALAGAVAGAAAFLVSSILPKQYVSEARVLVGSLTETSTDQLDAFGRLAETYASLATTTPILQRVSDRLGGSHDPVDLQDQIEARPNGQGIIRIIATGASPIDAMQIANAMAAEIVVLGSPAEPDGATSLATIIQPGLRPSGPSAPSIALNTLLATFLALALSAGIALLVGRSTTGSDAVTAGGPSMTVIRDRADERSQNGTEEPLPAAPRAPRAAVRTASSPATDVSATGVYVTGTTKLEPGQRYSIAVDGSRLRVLGPLELTPSAVALDRPVAGIDAASVDGRLVISQRNGKSGLMLAFMSVTGMSPDAVAGAITRAAAADDLDAAAL